MTPRALHRCLICLAIILSPGLARPEASAISTPIAGQEVGDRAISHTRRETSQAMLLAKSALDDIAGRYSLDRRALRDLVKGSKGFAVFTNLWKIGFIYTETHGQGFLVYRQEDGRWGPPVMLEVSGRSFGPQIGARVSDVLVVFKSTDSIVKLLSGQYAQGLLTPGVGGFGTTTESGGPSADITSYGLNRGLMLGQSVDEYHLRLLDQANLSLYGVPLKAGDIFNLTRFGHIPGPVQDFVQHVNLSLGEPANKTEWSAPSGTGR
jgi:lipid-binding SYLF domain-containing protein